MPLNALVDHMQREIRAARNRMTLVHAARGTVAVMVPLLVLQALGQPAGAVMAAIGGMNTAMADVGGAYRRRVLVMLLVALCCSFSPFLGCQMHGSAWLSALVLLVIAFLAGMARAFGQPGISIGINASIAFLVGTIAPQGLVMGVVLAAHYVLGSLWTMLFTLALWRLRPYRRLFGQMAAGYEAGAELVAALGSSDITRRRLKAAYHALLDAIQQAEATLDRTRESAGYSNPVFDRCVELLYALSREGAAALNLRLLPLPPHGSPAAAIWNQAFACWEGVLRAVAQALLSRRDAVDLSPVRAAFSALLEESATPAAAQPPLQLALTHLRGSGEALDHLLDDRQRFQEWWPRVGRDSLRAAAQTLRAQLNPGSFIFRHAVRVALAAAAARWLAGVLGLTHGLWMPMTVILVLQPEFGATWRRLLERIGGTLAGVLIAAALHLLVHGTAAEIALIAACTFGTFLLIRRNYGLGVTMVTPMILLLLGVFTPGEGSLLLARGADTVLGAVLALLAAYLLWPSWQWRKLLPQYRSALLANRDFLAAVLDAADSGHTVLTRVMQARQRAERETDNADATFQRMLAEPRRKRTPTRPALTFTAYLRRFTEHTFALAVALDGQTLSPQAAVLAHRLVSQLDAIAVTLDKGYVAQAQAVPAAAGPADSASATAWWLERIRVDSAALRTAANKLVGEARTTTPGDALRPHARA